MRTYKGFKIKIELGTGSVIRESDGWVLADGIEGSTDWDDPVFYEETMLDNCKSTVDEYLEHPERFEDEEDDPRPDAWEPYGDDYEKQEYDIRLKDNRIVKMCWPNAGKFHVLIGDEAGKAYDGDDVRAFRVSSPTSFEILQERKTK